MKEAKEVGRKIDGEILEGSKRVNREQSSGGILLAAPTPTVGPDGLLERLLGRWVEKMRVIQIKDSAKGFPI